MVTSGLEEWSFDPWFTRVGRGNRTRLTACSDVPYHTNLKAEKQAERESSLTEKLENKAIIIIERVILEQRAVKLLSSVPHTSLWLVDRDVGKLKKIGNVGAKRIAEDGVRFLASISSHLAPSTFIVPASARTPCLRMAENLYQ